MSMYEKKYTVRGFARMELLMGIAIMVMLASMVISSVHTVRSHARDVQRESDLKKLEHALQLYYGENARYPIATQWMSSEPTSAYFVSESSFVPGLAPKYIAVLPRDPKGTISSLCGSPYRHEYLYYSPEGTSYKLLSHCAPEGFWDSTHAAYDPVRPTWGWMICSGEPACSSW